MVGLQFLSEKFWFTTFFTFIPYFALHVPMFPRLTNHGNLQIFIALTLLLFLIFNLKKIRTGAFEHKKITNVFIYSVITMYVVSGFNKLNFGFFSLNSSCTTLVTENLDSFIFGSNYKPSALWIRTSQILTIIFEMIIPFGLLFYHSRKICIALMVGFHFYMSLCWYSNFSALAGFLLCGCIINFDREKDYYKKLFISLKIYIFFAVLSVLTSFAVARLGLFDKTYIRIYNGIIFNIGWIVFFFTLLKNSYFIKQKRTIKWIPSLYILFIIFWGGQAYLGLSNAGNLTMFSNLLTEKSQSNHFFINTKKTKIWSHEEDLVSIIDIPEHLKWQNSFQLKNYQLPIIEFKTQANQWIEDFDEPIELTIKYKDEIIMIPDLKHSNFSSVKWWYHYVYFRRIPEEGVNECQW